MLGRLFSAAASSINPTSSTKGGNGLESTLEEQHTANLLFADAILHHTGHTYESPVSTANAPITSRSSAFDDRGGLELDETRDLRVIIAQDAFAGQDRPCVLLDTKLADIQDLSNSPPLSPQTSWQRHSRGPSGAFSPRYPPTSPLGNSKQRSNLVSPSHARARSTTTSDNKPAVNSASTKEPDPQGSVGGYLDCIFGSTTAAKANSSVKMHLISPSTGTVEIPGTYVNTGRRLVPQDIPFKRQYLSRSQTTTDPSTLRSPVDKLEALRDSSQEILLITRTFRVDLPDSIDPGPVSSPAATTRVENLKSRKEGPEETDAQLGKKPKLRETKTPGYAVAIAFHLPRTAESRPPSRHSRVLSASPRAFSTLSSSLGSSMQSSWTLLDTLPFSPVSSQLSAEAMDARIETIVDHWDVIVRALAVIEKEASIKIYEFLRQAQVHTQWPVNKAPKEKTMQRTNQRIVQLHPWSLSGVQKVRDVSVRMLKRIARALRIPHAVTGLGLLSGGHWLEEARIVARFCQGRKQNGFLYILLTAFLGDHMEWTCFLHSFGALRDQHVRSGHRQQCQYASRSVLVCNQRTLARRIIYLLASFLPRPDRTGGRYEDIYSRSRSPLSSPAKLPVGSAPRPDMSASQAADGRGRKTWATRDQMPLLGMASSVGSDKAVDAAEGEAQMKLLRPSFMRKGSETPSLKAAGSLPIPTNGQPNRKISAAAANITTPVLATPVPHFVSGSQEPDSYFPPVATSIDTDGRASTDLQRLLRRGSSNFGPSTASTKWGSLITGFWSGKADSTTSSHMTVPSVPRDQAVSAPQGMTSTKQRDLPTESGVGGSAEGDIDVLEEDHDRPSTSRSIAIPPRLRVDERDGVVDVDLNLPGFMSSSLASRVGTLFPVEIGSLPPRPQDSSSSIHSSKSHAQVTARPAGAPTTVDVAGYLRQYHEDFALQAVKPYHELLEDVKRSMSLERSPSHGKTDDLPPSAESSQERWVNVCTTLIADVHSLSVHRVTLKRKLVISAPRERPQSDRSDFDHKGLGHPHVQPVPRHNSYSAEPPQEMFLTEPVTEFDPTLAEAIDRALNEASRQPSRAPSLSRTHSRTVSTNTTTEPDATPPASSLPSSLQPQHLQHRHRHHRYPSSSHLSTRDSHKVVVGALEEVVKSVNDDLHSHDNGRVIATPKSNHGNVSATMAAAAALSTTKHQHKEENALREGVRRWLLSVQEREVW